MRAKEMASSVHQHCLDLQGMLQDASLAASEVGVVVNYSEMTGELRKGKETGSCVEEKVWEACRRRERRWDLTIQLNLFEGDVDKVCCCGF